MSLQPVPPLTEVAPLSVLQAARRRLTLWLHAISSVACMLLWWHDEAHGLNSAWTTTVVPLIAAGLALGGLLIWLRPKWHDGASTLGLASVATYFVGSLIGTTLSGGPNGLYEVAANAQFMPLLYLAAFVTMNQGAAKLSWLTYGVTALSYGWLYGLSGSPGGDPVMHFWFMLLITHPIFILALSYVNVLHHRLKGAEIEAHTSKERFLLMLSHEIRTPLQGMLGSIDLLDLRVQGGAERRAVDRLRQIAHQLTAHLRDLTEYASLDNPAWRLQQERIDLSELLHDITDEHSQCIRAKGLNLQVEISEAPELRAVEIDPQRVRQVLDNLLSNALKYTRQGTITVRLAVCPDQPRGQPEQMQLEVLDTGVGIKAEAMSQIFEPHVRLEDPKLPRTQGSGLGLAVVRRLVDRLGGHLALESTPDLGSRFVVWLPLNSATPASHQATTAPKGLQPGSQ